MISDVISVDGVLSVGREQLALYPSLKQRLLSHTHEFWWYIRRWRTKRRVRKKSFQRVIVAVLKTVKFL